MIKYATRLPPGYSVELINDSIVRKTGRCSTKATLEFMQALVNHFIKNPDPFVVPVYRFEIKSFRKNNFSYQYDMERLGILSREERKMVDDIGDINSFYDVKLEPIFLKQELKYYEDKIKNHHELFNFLKEVIYQNRYFDINPGNVMKDCEENYRLIDLEGFIRTPLELENNSWIARIAG